VSQTPEIPPAAESLFIQIPGDTDPMDRYDLYEKPLNKALREAGRLGKTTGGGSGMSLGPRGLSVDCCYRDVDVKDLPRAVPVIRGALVRAKVPVGTLVGHHESDSVPGVRFAHPWLFPDAPLVRQRHGPAT
jgi:hypothetical protein